MRIQRRHNCCREAVRGAVGAGQDRERGMSRSTQSEAQILGLVASDTGNIDPAKRSTWLCAPGSELPEEQPPQLAGIASYLRFQPAPHRVVPADAGGAPKIQLSLAPTDRAPGATYPICSAVICLSLRSADLADRLFLCDVDIAQARSEERLARSTETGESEFRLDKMGNYDRNAQVRYFRIVATVWR